MTIKLTPKAAQALVNLRISDDWQTVHQWLGDLGLTWNQALVGATDADSRAVYAGMTRAMEVVVGAVNEAPQIVRELKHDS
jgi:hypothetical protein